MILQKNTDQHRWNFSRFGGVTQVILKDADDITHLYELDQKLWTVLAMPTQGIFFDPKTISLLDYDGDGFIRPPEILATVDWINTQLSDISLLLEEGDSVPLELIKDIYQVTQQYLTNPKDAPSERFLFRDNYDLQANFRCLLRVADVSF